MPFFPWSLLFLSLSLYPFLYLLSIFYFLSMSNYHIQLCIALNPSLSLLLPLKRYCFLFIIPLNADRNIFFFAFHCFFSNPQRKNTIKTEGVLWSNVSHIEIFTVRKEDAPIWFSLLKIKAIICCWALNLCQNLDCLLPDISFTDLRYKCN